MAWACGLKITTSSFPLSLSAPLPQDPPCAWGPWSWSSLALARLEGSAHLQNYSLGNHGVKAYPPPFLSLSLSFLRNLHSERVQSGPHSWVSRCPGCPGSRFMPLSGCDCEQHLQSILPGAINDIPTHPSGPRGSHSLPHPLRPPRRAVQPAWASPAQGQQGQTAKRGAV